MITQQVPLSEAIILAALGTSFAAQRKNQPDEASFRRGVALFAYSAAFVMLLRGLTLISINTAAIVCGALITVFVYWGIASTKASFVRAEERRVRRRAFLSLDNTLNFIVRERAVSERRQWCQEYQGVIATLEPIIEIRLEEECR